MKHFCENWTVISIQELFLLSVHAFWASTSYQTKSVDLQLFTCQCDHCSHTEDDFREPHNSLQNWLSPGSVYVTIEFFFLNFLQIFFYYLVINNQLTMFQKIMCMLTVIVPLDAKNSGWFLFKSVLDTPLILSNRLTSSNRTLHSGSSASRTSKSSWRRSMGIKPKRTFFRMRDA